jgi:tetratricopeptide (TPR) repeat protein
MNFYNNRSWNIRFLIDQGLSRILFGKQNSGDNILPEKESGDCIKHLWQKDAGNCFRLIAFITIMVSTLALVSSCAKEESKIRYSAEKQLFTARKMKSQLSDISTKSEFLDRTIEIYRNIVEEYRDEMYRIDGLEYIVLSAQMELSELQFSSGTPGKARSSFQKAYQMARNFPEASTNALYSCAVISEEMGDRKEAIESYSKLYSNYLNCSMALKTASMNTRYLLTPLHIAEIYSNQEKEDHAHQWLRKAEELFTFVAENSEDSVLVKEMRFNLLTTYVKSKNWSKAISHIEKLKKFYSYSEKDIASITYIEAQIYKNGFGKIKKAKNLFETVYRQYPGTNEALNALLNNANLEIGAGRFKQAKMLYDKIIEQYSNFPSQAARALWQLAAIAEEEKDWVEASLRYKELYKRYPATFEGMEAPLQLARHYKKRGESETAKQWYINAIDHYEELKSSNRSEAFNIMVEEYIVTSLSEQNEWEMAMERLLSLPEKYPGYKELRGNYLMAASICEKELGDKDRAIEILRSCVKKYPNTEVAAKAADQIQKLEGRR